MKQNQKILWFTWKDKKNMASGGAEIVNEELAKRLVADGHQVILLVAGVDGAPDREERDGYTVIRVGNRWSVYWEAYRYYQKHLVGWPDLVIEEVNTIPFLTHLYIKDIKIIYLFYQLCREIWFYQMFFPLNWIGYWLEPFYLRRMATNRFTVLTESKSARDDLARYGFDKALTHIFSIGLEIQPVTDLNRIKKYDQPTLLSLGAIREMKRPHLQIAAFEIAKQSVPNLKMKIAGLGFRPYFHKVMKLIEESPYRQDIEYLGKVKQTQKMELMQRAHLIAVTSVKEGWGLIVTEANSQGTPAVVYDVDGLRDSVIDGQTGLIAQENSPAGLAKAMVKLLTDQKKYHTLRQQAWQHSRGMTFDNGYQQFISILSQASDQ